MSAIRWEDIDHVLYERMVSVLLSHLFDAQRIDGAGGDRGKDVQFRVGGVLTIVQLKSFTGRMTPSRRKKVKRSLETAAQHAPGEWWLVVPIDPTAAELEWFETLTANSPFPCKWRGRTWLDTQMAQRPEFQRYFMDGEAQEVLRLLAQLREEQAALVGGAPQAVERARALSTQLNGMDVYFRYELTVGAAAAACDPPASAIMSVRPAHDARVDVFERYRGALLDRPITIQATFTVSMEKSGSSLS